MTAIHEVSAGISFLVSTLTADATLMNLAPGGVLRAFAPVGTPTPFCLVAFQSGIDTLTATGRRLMVRAAYQIKASGPMTDAINVFALASQIDVVLGGNQGLRNIAVPGGYVLAVYRESSLQYDEDVSGLQYTHMGGIYRIYSEQM